ncbi:phage tail tape measure protein [Listeria monocytogenes]|nr:phage tail tape measure protein [Listeria monocytogenes]MDF7920707.1 phage tail tape measure protein [Listeria monocytogenes]MDF7957262.1 phage tail tape measure protein [Listeria monocytogenes]MDF7995789.1 phage tail tape measure protein [Listeria monocytogenes]MDF7999153.1 phage tail tape measure protein [Listeria monocytogenes]
MSKAGEIYYDIKIRENGYKSQMNKIDKDMDNFAKKGQKASDNIDKINKKNINVKGLDSSIVKVEQFGNMLEKSGQKLTKVGTAMTVGFTAPIVAGMIKSTKAYLDFDNEVTEVNSLLRESGESAKEFGDRYTQVFDYAQKASVKYGVASEQTMLGMKEMVKKGYDINQTMASMPAIFNAARASGDDFETVMSVTTSTLEQFGMISKDTNKQMEYTNKVADVLTYVADKTAAGFSDMGTAMNYVGPISHSLGYSLTDTAAAVGLLSNRGIEGQKAGTGLRGMLTSLLKPSKSAAEAMAAVGLKIEDNNGNMKTLPTLLDDINDKTKKMTRTQKNSFLTMIFGREPLSAVNTLLEAGGDSLRKYSKGADEANGYTKQVADNMRKAGKFGVDQFKASLEVLEQNVGQKLMPALTPIIAWANKMIDKFNDLSGAQQQSIIKWAGVIAAAGPMLMIGGKLVSMTGGLIKGFAGFGKILGLGSKLAPLAAGFGATTTAVEGTSLAAAGLAGSFGALPAVIGLAGAALLGAGIYALDKHISKIEESKERVKTWGYDIGKTADESMTKFDTFSANAKVSMDTFANTATTDASRVVKAFKDMGDEIVKNTDKALKEYEKNYAKMDTDTQERMKGNKEKQEKNAEETKATVSAQVKAVSDIYKRASNDDGKLTANESKVMNNIYKAMQEEQIESLKISNSKKKQMIQAMNGDVKNLNQEALVEQDKYFTKIVGDTVKGSDARRAATMKTLKADHADQKTINKEMAIEDGKRLDSTKSSVAAWIKTQRELYKTLNLDSKTAESNIRTSLKNMGLDYDDYTKNINEAAREADKASNLIGNSASNADIAWNNLVLDPKTGEVRTNLADFLRQSTASKAGWDNLKFIMKEANLTTDAKKAIATALIENGKWNSLNFKEQNALLSTNSQQTLYKILKDNGTWDKLTYKQKMAFLQTNSPETAYKFMQAYGLWDKLSPKQKDMIMNTNANDVASQLRAAIGDWDRIPSRQQKVLEIAYKTNGKSPSGIQEVGYAKGTNNHSGGPALVNDARGSNYEEMITTPDGKSFVPKGRNVLLDLPRGTEVLRGDKTAKALRNVPHYAKGTSKQTAYAKNVNNKIANVQTDYKTGAINAQGYINKLKQINKQYTLNEAQTRKIRTNIAAANKEISTQKTKLNQAVKSSTQKYYDNVKKANDEAKASISEAKKTYNDALKANQESAYSQISLFDRAKTDKYAGSDLLANLKTQTQQQDEFIALINKLKKRKVNDGLVNELREQGLSATGQISAIANMSDKELQAYQAEWSKKHKNANAIGLDGSKSEKATMDKAILAANKKATTDIASAKNTWLKELGDAKQFKTAGSILGTQTVAGIITGFKNMNGPLQKESSNIAKTIENTIKKELDIHSPSRKMENEVGFQVIAGVGVGMRKNANIISIEAARMSKNLTNSIPRIDVPVTPNTQAINAYQSDSNKLVSNQKNIVANAQPIQVNLVLPDDSSTPVASWLINDIDTLLNAKTIISRVKAGG